MAAGRGAVQVSRWLADWEEDPDEVRDQALRVTWLEDERMACTLYVAWDGRLTGYDFGADHPVAPAGLS